MHNLYARFVKILKICKKIGKDLVNKDGNIPRRGVVPKFSDLEVLSLSMTSESLGIDSEAYLFSILKGYKKEFPNLISRRQYNDRRKFTRNLCETIRKRMADSIDGGEDYFCIDSKPIEVCRVARGKRCTMGKNDFAKARKRIETDFSQLCDQFMIIRNYAKDTIGLFTRIIGKISAKTIKEKGCILTKKDAVLSFKKFSLRNNCKLAEVKENKSKRICRKYLLILCKIRKHLLTIRMMKTLRMIGMALVAVLMGMNFASCNDDDAIEKSAYSEQIVGKWEITNYASMGTWHDSYAFKNDGTMAFNTLGHVDQSVIINGDWNISGDKLTIELRYDDYIEPKEYTIIEMKSDEMHWQDLKSGGKKSFKRLK